MEDMGITGTAYPAGEDVNEIVLGVEDTLQYNEEVAFTVDECPGVLGKTKDGSVGAIHGLLAVGEAHVMEVRVNLLWVDEEAVNHDILDDQTTPPRWPLLPWTCPGQTDW